MKNRLIGIVVALLGPCANATPTYVFNDFGSLGSTISYPGGINSPGQVVGTIWTTGNPAARATLWSGSTRTDLGTLGGTSSVAYGINDVGQVVGASQTVGDAAMHATLWFGSTASDLGTLGGSASSANGINASGQVVGVSENAVGIPHASLWSGAGVIDLGAPFGAYQTSAATGINNVGQVVGYTIPIGAPQATLWTGMTPTYLYGSAGVGFGSYARSINNSGQIVGWGTTPELGQHATIWNGSTPTDLGSLGGTVSDAFGINDAGVVVGWSYTSGNGQAHAALWEKGTIIDLNSMLDDQTVEAGWMLQSATAINGAGWIIGQASNRITGRYDTYLLSVPSVPEPETYALMLAGLTVLGVTVRRRRV